MPAGNGVIAPLLTDDAGRAPSRARSASHTACSVPLPVLVPDVRATDWRRCASAIAARARSFPKSRNSCQLVLIFCALLRPAALCGRRTDGAQHALIALGRQA